MRDYYFFIVVTLLLGVCFYDFIDSELNFSFIDELLVLYLFSLWIIRGKRNKELVLFGWISLFYLIYSLFQGRNVWQAVLVDFFIEIKPFFAFYFAYSIKFELSRSEQTKIRKCCAVLSILFLPIGLDYLMGNDSLIYTICGHPSRYCSTYQILGMLYIICSDHSVKYLKKGAFIIALSLLGGRSKAFGFFTVYMFLIYFPKLLSYRHLINYKNVTYFIILLVAVFYVARDKILFYFVTGSQSEEMFARPLMYVTSWKILMDHPLFGSGLGSYATYASSVYYSPIYYMYGLSDSEGLSPDDPSFIGDTFFPILAQFGFVGIFLFVIFWIKRLKFANRPRMEGKTFVFLLTILVVVFFLIEGIADSTFIQNRGVYVMMLYGFVLSNARMQKFSTQ